MDAAGDLWTTSFDGNTLDEFTPAQLAAGGAQSPAVVISSSSLFGPASLLFTPSGDLWVSNFQAHTLNMFTPSQLAHSGAPVPPVVISATGSSLEEPFGLGFDLAGNLWVTSYLNDQMDEFTPSQQAQSGSPVPANTITSAALVGPQGLAFDNAGDAWVGNADANTLTEFTASQLVAGGAPVPPVTVSSEGSGPSASLNIPYQIGFDGSGTLWVANNDGPSVSGFTAAQLASSGAPVPTDHLSGGATGLNGPVGLGLAGPPPPPTSVTATASGQTASVTWRAPLSPVYATDYQVTPVVNGTAQATIDTHSTATTFTASLPAGSTVHFEVTGSTVFGVGAPGTSNPVSGPSEPAGYDLAGSDGGVFVFPTGQSSGFFGSLPGLGVKVNNIVGIVPTNNFTGYNLVGSDGGVFVFPVGQSSGFFGSLPGLNVKVTNVVGIVPTNNYQGYDLVGSDGGVFVFPVGQSAGFYGSLPSMNVHVSDIVGIVASPGAGATSWSERTAGSSPSATPRSWAHCPASGSPSNDIAGIAAHPRRRGLLRGRGQRGGLRLR